MLPTTIKTIKNSNLQSVGRYLLGIYLTTYLEVITLAYFTRYLPTKNEEIL